MLANLGFQCSWATRHGSDGTALTRSLKLWSFYCDLEESLGTLESTRAVYDQILELRIATPQIILNYALFLQVHPAVLSKNNRNRCYAGPQYFRQCLTGMMTAMAAWFFQLAGACIQT